MEHKIRWVRAIGNISHDKDNKPTYLAGVINDITIHKQDEIRKNDFIAMASHELRSPLTTLQAYIQLLTSKARKGGDDFVITSLEKANIQVKKMVGLMNGFLNVSSFEAGKIRLDQEGVKEKDRDKLFGRYYRIDNIQTRNVPGFGLGLYLSAEIIRLHNGRIWVEGNEDNGASVSAFHPYNQSLSRMHSYWYLMYLKIRSRIISSLFPG